MKANDILSAIGVLKGLFDDGVDGDDLVELLKKRLDENGLKVLHDALKELADDE